MELIEKEKKIHLLKVGQSMCNLNSNKTEVAVVSC